jgi:hypothetical protein
MEFGPVVTAEIGLRAGDEIAATLAAWWCTDGILGRSTIR